MSDPLPRKLAELERELTARDRPGPPAALRGRVLAAVGQQLDAPTEWGWWQWASAAAAALLWANLSLSVANDTDWPLAPPPDRMAFSGSLPPWEISLPEMIGSLPGQEADPPP